ncbi:hypothetical protein X880_447 [Burkholderia pseudomallei MSHR4032]|nr:hypothetical protein X880_447 [Burkholderia pseudomallei MSHR4032]KGV08735.1 hypothetical protein X895_3281 [Burkholderia pseudomallei MSHR4503]
MIAFATAMSIPTATIDAMRIAVTANTPIVCIHQLRKSYQIQLGSNSVVKNSRHFHQ